MNQTLLLYKRIETLRNEIERHRAFLHWIEGFTEGRTQDFAMSLNARVRAAIDGDWKLAMNLKEGE